MARTAPSLFVVVLLLPLLVAACPTNPMSPPASPYGYEAMTGSGAAAYPSPFVAAPGAAAPPAAPRAEEEPAAAAPPEEAPPSASPPPVVLDHHHHQKEELLMRQGGAGAGAGDGDGDGDGDYVQRLDHLARVLDFLGYREMASSAPLLVSSPVLAAWPGPWTVFAIPDAAFMAAGCPAARATSVLMEHVALGATVRADVAAEPHSTTKLSTAAIGKCLTASASSSGPETTLWWVSGVEVAEPDLFNDGRLVVHGIRGVVKLPRRRSCAIDRSRRHRLGRPPGRVEVEDMFRDIFALAVAAA